MKNKLEFFIWIRVHIQPLWFIKMWQERRLKNICLHAYQHIPLYKKIWSKNGIITCKDIKEISTLPIINKTIFLQHQEAEYVYNYSPQIKYKWGVTSGSTGEPIRFLRAQYGNGNPEVGKWYFDAKQLRILLWDNIPFRKLSSIKVLELKGGENTNARLFIPIDILRRDKQESLNKIKEFNPDVIVGYSTFILELAKIAEDEDSMLKNVHHIIMGGQPLKSGERNLVRKVFQSDIYSRYSFEEFRAVGMECKLHNGFHIYPESYIFETVDDLGKAVPTNKSGRILITDLYNREMPFIRYDTGDYGRIDKAPCLCGLKSPRLFLEKVPQSYIDIGHKKISRGDTNKILGRYFNTITQYQIRKISTNEIGIVIVPGPFFHTKIMDYIKNDFSDLIGKEINIFIYIVKEIENIREGLIIDLTKK